MACEDRYHLRITNSEGESHGLICDWNRGGAGLRVTKGSEISKSSAVSTKGDYGVRDVDDHWRIIQTDWSLGSGQLTYDREIDSESAFDESYAVDIDADGELRIGPYVSVKTDVSRADGLVTLPTCIALASDSGVPKIWGAFSNVGSTTRNRLRWSTDGITWTAVSSSSIASDITDMCSDGRYIYAVAGGIVHRGDAVSLIKSSSATNASMTHVAYASGYLYAAKGTATTSAQLGIFDSGTWDSGPAPAAWTEMTPEYGSSINAQGSTFGLVASGNFVYWGVTNNNVTKVYKALFSSAAADIVFHEVCTFPTGFVGACMYSYLGTIYVGGSYSGPTTDKGIGSIYALVGDTPALLTDVGRDITADNRVLSMTAYERSLYFVSDSQIWRWDLVKGGYSHYAGPLNSTSTMPYVSITWVGNWTCDVAIGDGAEPDLHTGSPTTSGTTGGQIVDGSLVVTLGKSTSAWRRYDSDDNSLAGKTNLIDDTVGTTLEIDLPPSCLAGQVPRGGYLPAAALFGIKGSVNSVFVRVADAPVQTGGYAVELYEGNNLTDGTLIDSGTIPKSAGTLRLTSYSVPFTLGGEYLDRVFAAVLFEDEFICGQYATAVSDTPKQIWFEARKTSATLSDVTFTVNDIRWSDDGAYSSDTINVPAVSGVDLAAAGGKLFAACSGYGYTIADRAAYCSTATSETAPWIRSSRSNGGMPTVEKWFDSIHVSHPPMPASCSLLCTAIIDEEAFPLSLDTSLSTSKLSVFSILRSGKNIQWKLSLLTNDTSLTPRPTEVAVLFDPTPTSARVYTYFIRCWENAQDCDGNDWDETASIVADFLEEAASGIVTVERQNRSSYTGRLQALELLEAPPSKSADGREGLYQIEVRKVAT